MAKQLIRSSTRRLRSDKSDASASPAGAIGGDIQMKDMGKFELIFNARFVF